MFTTAFTDPQGTEHAAAVFQVLSADFSSNSSQSFIYSVKEGVGSVPNDRSNFSLSYRVAYWATQEAKDAGSAPYILIEPETYNSDFSAFDLDSSIYEGLSAEQAAEEHCKREVIKVTV